MDFHERGMLDDLPVGPSGSRRSARRDATLAACVNVGIGLWLVASPWVLGYGRDEAWWNPTVAGLVVALFAGGRMLGDVTEPGLARANFAVGIWLIASSFWLPPTTAAAVNNGTCGALVVLMALLAMAAARSATKPGV